MNARQRTGRRLVLGLLVVVALGLDSGRAGAQPPAGAQALIEAMSPEQRVGQLFLVPFEGREVADGTTIARLIDDYHVGGVVLHPSRGNFVNTVDAPLQVAELANALQTRAAAGHSPYVPLLVALPQLGEDAPDKVLHGGMTPLPSAMALGATWQPGHAEKIGELMGRELAAVGVNLLLGPSLDVVSVPRPGASGDLGVRVFGGSPAWVARFGQRFIAGMHRGSDGRVAAAAGSFPGIGGADRGQAEEGAVVESPLEDLASLELIPFVAAADGGGSGDAISDGFVGSHVRFRGIQQQTDRPLSLDSGGLRYLWSQVPELATWRAGGGVLVSPGLGQPAVRRYVDPELATFNVRRVVDEALSAGNDLLFLDLFGPPDAPLSSDDNIIAAIEWLTERYQEDEGVRDAVDAALSRIISLKLRMYGDLAPGAVTVDAEGAAAQLGLGGEDVATVAREALTLISPAGTSTVSASTASPQPGERILLIVDARPVSECETCESYLTLDPEALRLSVLRSYGPDGSGRVRDAGDVAAITFDELKATLQSTGDVAVEDTPVFVPVLSEERQAAVSALLAGADWLVFAMRDIRSSDSPASDALKLFLDASPTDAGDRRIVALAFGAPYYLDTTDIAKLTGYFALYAHTEPFIEVAVRALFGDEAALGASPVSVPGAGYDLARRLQPSVDQVVGVELVGHDPARPLGEGDNLTVRTSVVHDLNGNMVPEGTKVTFRRYDQADDVFLQDVPATTDLGRATAVMRADRAGELVITAAFDNGLRSEPLELVIEPAEGDGASGLPLPGVALPLGLSRPRVPVDWGIFTLSLTVILLAGLVFTGIDDVIQTPVHRVRVFLLIVAWGLAGYLLVAAGGLQLSALPGGGRLWPTDWNVAYQAPLLAFVFALIPTVPAAARSLTGARSPTGTPREP